LNSISDISDKLMHCIYAGIVVSYARSFTKNEGLSKLDSKFEKFTDSEFSHTHKTLLLSRNKIYAHRDSISESTIFDETPPQEEINEVYIEVTGKGKGNYEVGRSSLPKEYVAKILNLAKFQKVRIENSLAKMINHFVESNNLSFGRHKLQCEQGDGEEPSQVGSSS
jgi:hypothetical protein